MPLIQVSIAAGRNEDQIRALVSELTDAAVRTIGARPEAVWVIVTEVQATHWADGGQTLADRTAGEAAAAAAAAEEQRGHADGA